MPEDHETVMPERYFTTLEILKRYGISRATLTRLINAGTFPPADLDLAPRSPRWSAESLARWEASRKVSA